MLRTMVRAGTRLPHLAIAAAVVALICLTITAPRASATGFVVTASSLNGWDQVNFDNGTAADATGTTTSGSSSSFSTGPGTPPAGTGSLHQHIGTDGNDGVRVRTSAYNGTSLSSLSPLSYSTYVTTSGGQAAYMVLLVDLNGNGTYDSQPDDDALFFEPVYQNGGYSGDAVPDQCPSITNCVDLNTWQTWDAAAGGWWSALDNSGGPPLHTLANYVTAHPGAALITTGAPALRINAGFGAGAWDNYNGYFDNVTITSDTYDFELTAPPQCSTDCYVRTDGNDANTGTADTAAAAKRTIQAAASQVSSGGTVHVAGGTYAENVTISTPLTLAGAGEGSTTVVPAFSNPVCGGGSLCGGAASNIILVQANNVTVHDLTLDGDNPSLTSAVVAGGADIDARNGIITNHAVGVYQNLTVRNTTIKNIYLRGVYASSGGSFNFHDDTVQNVQGEVASIGMFNFGGSGSFASNNVSDANDAISSNWSTGTTYTNNVVTSSGSGVHTDNNGGFGGVADVLDGNAVSNCDTNGYGVWTFAPYRNVVVQHNVVTNCAVGLAAAGQNAPATTAFIDNEVDGTGLAGSTGVYVTTSLFGFGSSNVSATFTGNIIKNNADGVFLEAENAANSVNVTAQRNDISANSSTGVSTATTGTINAIFTADWWGDATGPLHALNPAGTGNSVANGIAYSPWLGDGADASPAVGFQLASPMTWYAGPAVCNVTCIQAAVDFSANGDTVKAKTGVFPEHVIVNKEITITAGSNPIIDGGGSGDGITITANNVNESLFEIRNVTNGVVVNGGNNASVGSNNIHNFTSAAIRGSSATGANIASNAINGGHSGSCVGGFWGIFLNNVSGTVSANTASGIGNGITTGCQEGRAIEADGTGTVIVANNVVSTYQKSGIIIRDSVNSTISGNTATGEGPSGIVAMNGITVVSTGATSISGNQTSGHRYTPESDFSCGILYFPLGNPSSALSVTNNDSTEDEVGLCLSNGTATSPVTGVTATGNIVTKHHQQAINIDGLTNALVDGNQIDGQAGGTTASAGSDPDTDTRYYGIFAVNSTGTISNNTIKGITHGPANGTQSGVGIRVTARSGSGSSNVTVSGNNISDVEKNAMVITNAYGGASVNANVTGNTVAGNGPVNYIAQNGIQVSGNATASLTGNDVSGYDYTPSNSAAVGVLIIGAGNVSVTNNNIHDNMEGMYVQSTNGATVNGNSFTNTRDTAIFTFLSSNGSYTANTIFGLPSSVGMYVYDTSQNNTVSNNAFRDNDYGVFVDYTAGAPGGNQFHQNCIAGNATAGMATTGTVSPSVDATNNWWGAADGPNPPGSGDVIDSPATINATPFLTSPVAGCPAPVTPTPTVTSTDTATNTPVATDTPVPTATSTPTDVPTATNTASATSTPTTTASTIVVSPANMNGWAFVQEQANGTGTMVVGPPVPPLGAGSANMTVDATGRELLATLAYANTRFDQITSLQYSTYQNPLSAASSILATSLQFDVDYNLTDGNLAFQGRLVFEPYFTQSVVKGAWQTWNPMTSGANWWSTGAPGNTVCPQSSPCTWAQVLANFPNAGIRSGATTGVLEFKAGGPWPGFDGNVDAFTIGVNTTQTTYDFEPTIVAPTSTATATATETPVPTDTSVPPTPTATATATITSTATPDPGLDTDGDGCPDLREMGADWHTGGQRDPNNPWDFFDVPLPVLLPAMTSGVRDKAITIGDAIAVLQYVGTTLANPNAANSNGAKYGSDLNANGKLDGTEYDRSPSTVPGEPWHSGAPNGAVSVQDALIALNQVGTNCN